MLRNNKGMVVALLVLMIPVVVGMAGYVTDLSIQYLNRTRIENAVDFSALAGISQLTSQANVNNAKQTALNYLNNNLSTSLPSFSSLSLNSEGLSIQAGVYDFMNLSFTVDEQNSNVNALKISYTYNSPTFLSRIFMISSATLTKSSTAAKQPAGCASPGTGFPIVIDVSSLSTAAQNNNMLDLSIMNQSYWTQFTNSNPSATDVNNIINYFQSGNGTSPSGVNVNDNIRINDGNMNSVFMTLDPNILVGMDYLFSVVTINSSTNATVNAFVSGTINQIVSSMGNQYITITIMPGNIDNTFGGLQICSGQSNVSSSNQSLLANAFGIVQ